MPLTPLTPLTPFTPAGPGLPVLYSFRRCPYAMRARLAIKVAGLAVVQREVLLGNKPAELLAASPKATVPVLLLPSGAVLDESLDIMRWALALHDPQGWLRADECEAVQSWTLCNDGPFKQALDRTKYASGQAEAALQAWRDEAVAVMLAPMEAQLAQHRFLLRSSPSMADIALLPFVRQFAGCDADAFGRLPLKKLQAWLAFLTGQPLFESVMTKLAPWQPGAVEALV